MLQKLKKYLKDRKNPHLQSKKLIERLCGSLNYAVENCVYPNDFSRIASYRNRARLMYSLSRRLLEYRPYDKMLAELKTTLGSILLRAEEMEYNYESVDRCLELIDDLEGEEKSFLPLDNSDDIGKVHGRINSLQAARRQLFENYIGELKSAQKSAAPLLKLLVKEYVESERGSERIS